MKKILIAIGTIPLVSTSLATLHSQRVKNSKAVFETLKRLVGTWEGEAPTGMKERLETKLIADKSVLMETSSMSMATMYHLDGDRVMLTHYCMAKNQPRLVASDTSPDGKTITFTFLDGTNLPSRNVGHMDRVVIRFVDRDTYRTKWVWYQDGQEKWMEDFTFRRVKPPKGPK